jgi:hypothetical protein
MLEENEEITGQDIQETETELGIDIDEIDYCGFHKKGDEI